MDTNAPVLTFDDIWSLFGYQKGDPLSMSQIIAGTIMIRAINGDIKAIDLATLILDGPPEKVYY